VTWLRTHSFFLFYMSLFLGFVVVLYVGKKKQKEPYLGYFYAKTIIEASGCKDKNGTHKVTTLMSTCPNIDWEVVVLGLQDCKNIEYIERVCRKVTDSDFYFNRKGLVVR
jgi:hypothetical protein